MPLAAGSQCHAKVAQRKSCVFMALAQKAAPQGHGLAVQGNALGMVALFFFYAPKILGGRDSCRAVAGEGARTPAECLRLTDLEWKRLGADWLLSARVEAP